MTWQNQALFTVQAHAALKTKQTGVTFALPASK